MHFQDDGLDISYILWIFTQISSISIYHTSE